MSRREWVESVGGRVWVRGGREESVGEGREWQEGVGDGRE